jgi:predicted RNA-binding protein (virulence factor B family)
MSKKARDRQDSDYAVPAPGTLQVRQSVELEIIGETALGFKALVEDRYIGLIYRDEISQPLRIGEYLTGWVKLVRPDGKIDLSITQLDSQSRNQLQEEIIRHLRSKGGVAKLSDKTAPEEIFRLFKTSKKNFKRAIGSLYKARRILIGDTQLTLVQDKS